MLNEDLVGLAQWLYQHKLTYLNALKSKLTVEPVYNDHPQDLRNWLLNTGGGLIQDH